MYDAAATSMMTVCDLLVHRSGLPLGAGDLDVAWVTITMAEEICVLFRTSARDRVSGGLCRR